MLDALWTDLRLAVRSLRQSPGFSTVVALTFALAIGANTTVFSLLNAVVLRTAPVEHPDGLVSIAVTDTRTSQPGYIHLDTFTAFRAAERSFSNLSMYWGGFVFRVEARDTALEAGVEGVMPAYFDLVGAHGLFTPFYPHTAPGNRPWSPEPLGRWLANPRAARGATTMLPVPVTTEDLQA